MTTYSKYFINTTHPHNKDYRLTWSTDTFIVTSEFGPIGGRRTIRTKEFRNFTEVSAEVRQQEDRRMRHGYTLVGTETYPATVEASAPSAWLGNVASGSGFARDINDLKYV